jgi:hypothetical protein
MRALLLGVVLLGCSSDPETPAPATDAGADVAEAAVDTGPVSKCATVRCDSTTVCDPLDGACKPAKFAKLGAACTSATCTGAKNATCLEGDYPDGYCSVTPCDVANPCPLASSCVKVSGKQVCLQHCGIDADCRGGIEYKCQDVSSLLVAGGSRSVCYLPAFSCATDAECPAPLKCNDGKTCT